MKHVLFNDQFCLKRSETNHSIHDSSTHKKSRKLWTSDHGLSPTNKLRCSNEQSQSCRILAQDATSVANTRKICAQKRYDIHTRIECNVPDSWKDTTFGWLTHIRKIYQAELRILYTCLPYGKKKGQTAQSMTVRHTHTLKETLDLRSRSKPAKQT